MSSYFCAKLCEVLWNEQKLAFENYFLSFIRCDEHEILTRTQESLLLFLATNYWFIDHKNIKIPLLIDSTFHTNSFVNFDLLTIQAIVGGAAHELCNRVNDWTDANGNFIVEICFPCFVILRKIFLDYVFLLSLNLEFLIALIFLH